MHIHISCSVIETQKRLIYNLVYKGSGSLPSTVNNQPLIDEVVTSIKQWSDEAVNAQGPIMMAYLFEHKYCEASLFFKRLKNIDRAVGDLLIHAHEEVNFELYLASVSISRSWSATSYEDCRWCENYDLDELVNEEVIGSNLVTPRGKKADLKDLELDKDLFMLLDDVNLDKPDEEEFQEATGNEGATVDRWY